MHNEAMQSDKRTRDLALIATFAGLVGAMGLVPGVSPFGFPVPVTVQTLGVMITGAVLGGRRGGLSMLLFLGLVALGLPLLSGGRGGLAVFTGPSAGYVIGFPVAAFVIGSLVYRFGAPYRLWLGLPSIVFGGIVVLYCIGIPVTAWRANLELGTAIKGSAFFLIGDSVKAVIATLVADAVHRAVPDLLPRRQSSKPRATKASANPSA